MRCSLVKDSPTDGGTDQLLQDALVLGGARLGRADLVGVAEIFDSKQEHYQNRDDDG